MEIVAYIKVLSRLFSRKTEDIFASSYYLVRG